MSTIVKNIHIFKDGAWHPIKKVFKDGAWRTMKGIFYEGVWYEIGATCVVMPDGCAVSATNHPRWGENTAHYGTNNFGFNAIPGGYRYNFGTFSDIGNYGLWWSATENDADNAWYRNMHYNTSNVNRINIFKKFGFSVRCVKDYTGTQPNGTILTNNYTDGNGNTYDAVVIGKQLWTVENLYTTKYQNGYTNIPNVTNSSTWKGLTTGAYCWYNNDDTKYGALYNWYAVNNGLVNNNGYRVPSDADWTQLTDYLINTNWCSGVVVTSDNVAQFLKSCRQVNHPLGPSMSVSPNTFNIDIRGGTFYFDISSNYNQYTISGEDSWIRDISPSTASGNRRVYFTILSNEGVPPYQTLPRQASLSIKDSLGQTITTVSITQDGDVTYTS